VLSVACPITQKNVSEAAANGLSILATSHNFGEQHRKDPKDYSRDDARAILKEAAKAATAMEHNRADVLASLMSDAAIKMKPDKYPGTIDPTPFCLLFGQGRQHFFERLEQVPSEPVTALPKKGKMARMTVAESIAETLFAPWNRTGPLTCSFRWDPEEAARYALIAGNPTDSAYKGGTQHGANRLAAVGLAVLTLIPKTRGVRIRPSVIGGSSSPGGFSFAWPIWQEPATLSAIRALLGHPDLRKSGHLMYLGVDHVLIANRISVGEFMNFTRARIADRD
jgi:hypothetical protein